MFQKTKRVTIGLTIALTVLTIGIIGENLTKINFENGITGLTITTAGAATPPKLTFNPPNFFSTSGIITCVNSTDPDLDSLNYTLSVTFLNSNNLLENKILNTSLNSSSFNGTTGFFNVSSLPAQVYNITCNVSDGTSITSLKTFQNINRAPTTSTIPNFSMPENSAYSLNVSSYFNSEPAPQLPTGQDLLLFNASGNFTFTIKGNLVNLTPPPNFFGLKTFNITAFDLFGGNTTSNEITVNITNVVNINETFPVNGANTTTPSSFRASVYDDNPITNCTLRINNTTQTTNNPSIGPLTTFGDDDGTDESTHFLSHPTLTGTIFKNVTTTSGTNQISIRLKVTGTPNPLNISIDSQNFSITSSDIKSVCGTSKCDYIKPLNSSFPTGKHTIILKSTFQLSPANYYEIYIDTGTTNNNSSNSVSGDIVGEYMIRLVSQSRIVEFTNVSFSSGKQTWNISCTNNLGQQGISNNSIVQSTNIAPTTPTFLLPTTGVFNKEINISCGGSTDANENRLTYLIQYKKESEPGIVKTIGFTDSGNITFNTSQIPNGARLMLFCAASDTKAFSSEKFLNDFDLNISHPNSPTPPTSLTCNSGMCSGFTTGDVTLTCSGSIDSDSGFQYFFEAKYKGFNGSQWYPISNVTSLIGSVLLNTNRIANNTDVGLRCYADDEINVRSDVFQTTNITTNHPIVPGIPTVLTPIDGEFQDQIPITIG